MTTRRIMLPNLGPVDDAHAIDHRRVWQEVRDWCSQTTNPSLLIEDSSSEIVGHLVSLRAAGSRTPFSNNNGPIDDPFEPFLSLADDPFIEIEIEATVAGAHATSADRILASYLEQLFTAMNLAAPGSLNLRAGWEARGEGQSMSGAPGIPSLDSEQLYWSWAEADEARRWPVIVGIPFSATWPWLADQAFYGIEIARESCHKALFALLQLSRRDRSDPDNVLLVVSAIENVLFGSAQLGTSTLQSRIERVLGAPDEASWKARGGAETWYGGKWITALYRPRSEIAHGAHPLLRPGWLEFTRDPQNAHIARRLQDPIDLGTAILLALLQDLILHGATAYEFGRDGDLRYR